MRDNYLEEYYSFLRFPSVSTDDKYKQKLVECADWLVSKLNRIGLQTQLVPTKRHPIVWARNEHRPGRPTVLFYGHYDVQPPDPLDLWESPPFEPSIRNGNIYARGACDDKGQMYMHVKAVETLHQSGAGNLPVNVKFLVEGEEEVGGESISEYVPRHRDKLKSNVALVSDTELFGDGIPTLCIGLRGLIYLEIEAKGPMRDLHSGMYGGAAPNAVYGLIELLAKA